VDPELVKWIKEVKKQGHSHETIREHLIKNGYNHEDVDKAFKHPSLKVKKKAPILLILTVLLLISLVVAASLFFFRPKNEDGCENVNLIVQEKRDLPLICRFSDYSNIQIFLQNKGSIRIKDVYLEISADSNYKELVTLNIEPNDVIPYLKEYKKEMGEIKKISLTPSAQIGNETIMCQSKKITFEDIRTC